MFKFMPRASTKQLLKSQGQFSVSSLPRAASNASSALTFWLSTIWTTGEDSGGLSHSLIPPPHLAAFFLLLLFFLPLCILCSSEDERCSERLITRHAIWSQNETRSIDLGESATKKVNRLEGSDRREEDAERTGAVQSEWMRGDVYKRGPWAEPSWCCQMKRSRHTIAE